MTRTALMPMSAPAATEDAVAFAQIRKALTIAAVRLDINLQEMRRIART